LEKISLAAASQLSCLLRASLGIGFCVALLQASSGWRLDPRLPVLGLSKSDHHEIRAVLATMLASERKDPVHLGLPDKERERADGTYLLGRRILAAGAHPPSEKKLGLAMESFPGRLDTLLQSG
jgi:hypothetical protein